MTRIKGMYFRFFGAQLPVFQLVTEKDWQDWDKLIAAKAITVTRTQVQMGFQSDIVIEVIEQRGETSEVSIYAIMTVEPGGYEKRKQRIEEIING